MKRTIESNTLARALLDYDEAHEIAEASRDREDGSRLDVVAVVVGGAVWTVRLDSTETNTATKYTEPETSRMLMRSDLVWADGPSSEPLTIEHLDEETALEYGFYRADHYETHSA